MKRGWHKPFMTGYVHQKTFGVKVGHVVSRRDPWYTSPRYVALFDGNVVGIYPTLDQAKEAVDRVGGA